MFRTVMIGAVSAVALASSVPALAQQEQQDQFGTATEAKVMLEKAVFAVKADKAKALGMFNKGESGFKDRDLYPFCFNIGNGIVTAGPSAVLGKDVRTLTDPTGKAFGADFYNAPREGTNEVSYMFPRPGTDLTPVEKISFVARAGDQGCGVGYYKYAVQQPIILPDGNVALPWQR
jgi:signal transduction histidine kinase